MKARSIVLTVAGVLTATLLSAPSTASTAVSGPPAATGVRSSTPQAAAVAARARNKSRWHPQNNKAFFNNPYGNVEGRFKIQRYLVSAIRNTPSTGQIRMSVYSFDRPEVADALLAARKRGVRIQILMNDHQVTFAQRRLFARLGTNPRNNNFAYLCKASCRARRDNLHSKFFLFSRTGGVDDVVMMGSVNFTLNAVKWQWNDLLSLTRKEALYDDFVSVFDDMRKDYSSNQPYRVYCGERNRKGCSPTKSEKFLRVFPRRSSARNDAVLKLLDPIKCLYRVNGQTRRTQLRLSMHTMRGPRGDYLASRMRSLWAKGCDVKIIYGLMGYYTKRKLGASTSRGRVPLRSAGFDYDGDGQVNRYTHHKYLTIAGSYGGRRVNLTFTGSSNWSARGASGDEIIFSLRNPQVWSQYQRNFGFMFNSNRHTRNAYTTTAYSYRTVVMKEGLDGTLRPTYVTRRVVTEQNLPDRIEGRGATWEND